MNIRQSLRDQILKAALIFVSVVVAVALWRDTFYNGWDFGVYWRAARAWREGRSPYLEGSGTLWVFKYPPWVLYGFWPLSFLSESSARAVWGVVELLSLSSIASWIRVELRVGVATLVAATLPFWFLLAYHALAGQLVLTMTALGLWLWVWTPKGKSPEQTQFLQVLNEFFLAVIWSVKSTSIWVLVGRFHQKFFREKTHSPIWVAGLGFLIFALATVWFAGHSLGIGFGILEHWSTAMRSGSEGSAGDGFLGWRNQSLAAAAARLVESTGLPVLISGPVFLGISFTVAVLLVPLGILWTRRLHSAEIATVWIALGAVVQPLAWFHGFVQAWPLALLVVDRAFRAKKLQIPAVLALLMVTVMSGSSMGRFGELLLLFSVKSWGVLLLCAVLGRLTRLGYTFTQ